MTNLTTKNYNPVLKTEWMNWDVWIYDFGSQFEIHLINCGILPDIFIENDEFPSLRIDKEQFDLNRSRESLDEFKGEIVDALHEYHEFIELTIKDLKFDADDLWKELCRIEDM